MRFLGKFPEVRAFETPSSTDQTPNTDNFMFKPNLYVSISKEWNKKIKALKHYKHELGHYPHPRSLKNLEASCYKERS